MKRFAVLLLFVLGACAPVQDFNASILNEVTNAIGVLTANEDGITVRPVEPLGHTVVVISGKNVRVIGDNCNATGPEVTCTWPEITEPQYVTINGTSVSVTASYRVKGTPGIAHEVLR